MDMFGHEQAAATGGTHDENTSSHAHACDRMREDSSHEHGPFETKRCGRFTCEDFLAPTAILCTNCVMLIGASNAV